VEFPFNTQHPSAAKVAETSRSTALYGAVPSEQSFSINVSYGKFEAPAAAPQVVKPTVRILNRLTCMKTTIIKLICDSSIKLIST